MHSPRDTYAAHRVVLMSAFEPETKLGSGPDIQIEAPVCVEFRIKLKSVLGAVTEFVPGAAKDA